MLEPEDAEQERRDLFIVANAIRCERDPCGNREQGDREQRDGKASRAVAFQVEREPGQDERQQGHEIALLEPR